MHNIYRGLARLVLTIGKWPGDSRVSRNDHRNAQRTLIQGLIRHLDDEEDLIVPLILDRGEAALGVAHHG
jgi:hypothetical protein